MRHLVLLEVNENKFYKFKEYMERGQVVDLYDIEPDEEFTNNENKATIVELKVVP